MMVNGQPCPPPGVTHDVGYTGRARDVFDCGMCLLIGWHDGKQWLAPEGDILENFQSTFAPVIAEPDLDLETCEAIVCLLYTELAHFDDWFYDLAFCRFFPLVEANLIPDPAAQGFKALFVGLIRLGYSLNQARTTALGQALLSKTA